MRKQSRLLVAVVLFVLFLLFADTVSADEVYKMSGTSLREGKGPHDVVRTDVETFLQDELFQLDEAVLYIDCLWSIDSKRKWPVVQDIYSYVSASKVPMYVYQDIGWEPSSPSFRDWWQSHVSTVPDFPKFTFTKYRAILLVVKKGRIAQIMVNAVVGEGGGFCVHKVVMNALGRPVPLSDLTPTEADYYDVVCVGTLHHPERAMSVNMWSSPCGWSRDDTPDECKNLLKDEL